VSTAALPGWRRTDALALLAITIVWAAAIVAVFPRGDFPINDDWSYGRAVQALVDGGVWRLTDFTSMPLATQLVWGALFCLPRGFSFEALRASTLVLGWLGGVGLYRLVREVGGDPATAFAGALTLLLCPVYFALSFTFMTDVPFTALAVWSAVAIVRLERFQRTRDLAAAVLLICGATLLRQFGLLLSAGAVVAILRGGRTRRRLARVVLATALPIAALLSYNAFLRAIGEPWFYHRRDTEWLLLFRHAGLLAKTIATRAWQILIYLGLFLGPAVIAFGIRPVTSRGRRLAVVFAAGVAALSGARSHAMPVLGNVLSGRGLNPLMIAGATNWPAFPSGFWLLVTGAAIAAAAAVAATLAERMSLLPRLAATARRRGIAAVAAMLVCSTAPLLVVNLFDRYLLVPAAFAIALAAAGLGRRPLASRTLQLATLAALAGLAVFDVAAVHDTFAFDRARWAAVDRLVAQGVAPDAIDGGFEVNGWLSYRADRRYQEAGAWWAEKPHPAARLSLVPAAAGFAPVASFRFHRWLPLGWGVVYVLKPDLL
jgi:dolichyl-phosphate-mannose-protein mannosyltransferase